MTQQQTSQAAADRILRSVGTKRFSVLTCQFNNPYTIRLHALWAARDYWRSVSA